MTPVSYILGEILDSFYMRYYTIEQYRARINEYLNAFADKVDVWEIATRSMVNGWVLKQVS